MLDYFAIINRYYTPGSRLYKIYVIHAVLATNKALRIAAKLHLDTETKHFIEEAAMLHDIGICQTDSPKLDCYGQAPYLCHGLLGAEILRRENLPKHALVAERHVGVGLPAWYIREQHLPLPERDFVPESLPEEIIAYADCFYSKHEATLWEEESLAAIRAEMRGDEQLKIFNQWHERFGDAA